MKELKQIGFCSFVICGLLMSGSASAQLDNSPEANLNYCSLFKLTPETAEDYGGGKSDAGKYIVWFSTGYTNGYRLVAPTDHQSALELMTRNSKCALAQE